MSVVIAENACLNNPINPAHIPFLKYHPITGIYVWGFHNNDNLFIPIYIGHHNKIFEGIFNSIASVRGGSFEIPIWLQRLCLQNPTANYALNRLDNVLQFNNTNHPAKKTVEYIIENFQFIYLEIDDIHCESAKKYLAERIGRDRIINQVHRYTNNLPEEITIEINSVFGSYYTPSV